MQTELKQANKGSMRHDFQVTSPTKSAFNLTYNNHPAGLIIGRNYPVTYQHIMPADKFSGSNEYSLIAERLATPLVSDVNLSVHNFFVTYRSIDRGFEDLMTPTKLNNMSNNLSAPTFKLVDIFIKIVTQFTSISPIVYKRSVSTPWYYVNDISEIPAGKKPSDVGHNFLNQLTALISSYGNKLYISDILLDLYYQLQPYFDADYTGNTTMVESFYKPVWRCVLDFFIGEGSVMDYLGYPIIKHSDVDDIFSMWLSALSDYTPQQEYLSVYDYIDGEEGLFMYGSMRVDDRPLNEYALRAYYAIWFEHFRDKDLEPRSADLPEYRNFGSSSLFSRDPWKYILCLLPLRCRNWTADPFTTAGIDDISRHVFAPILSSTSSGNIGFTTSTLPAQLDIQTESRPDLVDIGGQWSDNIISFIDQFGVRKTITCPLPVSMSNILPNFNYDDYTNHSYGLSLFALKKAKMYENYLKRNLAFGDEYKDRMKAHYDVTIEDYRINRPQWLSGSVSRLDVQQEVANTGVQAGTQSDGGMVEQGSRLATGTASNQGSDGFTFFSTEFGIYIGMLSVLPRAQYDTTCSQNFMQKTMDFPTPEFANQQEEIMNSAEIYRKGIIGGSDFQPFGHVPYAHAYRYRVDEVHGQSLSAKFDYTFARFFRGLTDDAIPKLNYQFVHCRPNIPMFVNKILLDGQFYGTTKHNFLVERLLPVDVETI